jgi:DNA processing protein
LSGPPSDDERLAALRLARAEGVGPVGYSQLVTRYRTPQRALEALPDLAARGGRAGRLGVPSVEDGRREIEAGESLGARLLILGETAFPALLAALDAPPPLLWALGRLELLQPATVAIVGARNASAAGMRFARQLAADLGAAGQTTVSGLARGIDGAAHQGALTTAASTIAVMAGGLDDIYPPEHAELHARIAAEGCVVSENQPGRRAQARDFPRRNRIVSGLSLAVVVVEAELRSGSLITARLAGEQGRDVFAVPGSPLDPRARGANDLIRHGAGLCESAEDVLRELHTPRGLGEGGTPGFNDDLSDLDDDPVLRERLAELLSPTPVSRDELIRATGSPTAAVLAVLLELSLAGRAELLPGGMVASG